MEKEIKKTITKSSDYVTLTVRVRRVIDRALEVEALNFNMKKQDVVELALMDFLRLEFYQEAPR
jgi:hypothetical protein